MTVTVKLDASLEAQLRRRAAATGRSTSGLVRSALTAYLAQPDAATERSAYALGTDLFGRHEGSPDLATERKRLFGDIVAEKHARQSAR